MAALSVALVMQMVKLVGSARKLYCGADEIQLSHQNRRKHKRRTIPCDSTVCFAIAGTANKEIEATSGVGEMRYAAKSSA